MPENPQHEVAIVGAGAGGICAAVKLAEIGVTDVVLLERADKMGGTWQANTYPGVGADIPALAYQFSFARKHDWKRFFGTGAEIQAYHLGIAEKYGLPAKTRLGVTVESEVWDEDNHLWRLNLAGGECVTARFVICATGAYLNPKENPDIPGLTRFNGKTLIPSRWDHDYDLRGKRVGIVGVGSSTVQIAPAIADTVTSLDIYQRTPQWYFPKPDFDVPWILRQLLRIPGVSGGLHGIALVFIELGLRFLVHAPASLFRRGAPVFDSASRLLYRRWLRIKVRDKSVREALVPRYGPGCTRGTLGGDYLPVFNRDNVTLVADGIREITENAVVAADGTTRKVDTLILATGYEVFSDPESYRDGVVKGANGFDLGTFFNTEGLQAYLSTAVAGMPNRWLMVGPYSWTGTGFHYILENAMISITRSISAARERGATRVEVKASAMREFHDQILRDGANIDYYFNVHCAGSNTYFVNSHGQSPYVRPASLLQNHRRAKNFPLDDLAFGRLPDNVVTNEGEPALAEVQK